MAENGKLKIYVLDCLNEVRYKGAVSKQKVKDSVSTKENKLGRPDIDENGNIILTKESLEMKNYYDQHNLDPYLYDLKTGDPSYTYYGLLDYSLRSQNDDRIMNDKQCHNKNGDFIQNIINTCQYIYQKKTNTQKKNFFVGTHGNRLKAALQLKGIAVANCFCLKISNEGTEILFDGFKMYEGDRKDGSHTKKKRKCYVHKEVISDNNLKAINGCYKKKIITKKNEKKNLDSEPVISYEEIDNFKKNYLESEGLTYNYKFENEIKNKNLVDPINIYIIRHGDAMHNDKFNLGHYNIDSSLTPIGMMQAYLVGEKIKKILEKNKDPIISLNNSCILSSYLNRAQHTALLALYSACDYPEDRYFKSVINVFNNMAFERVHEKIKAKKKDNAINFIKDKIKDFCEQNEVDGDKTNYNRIINTLPENFKNLYNNCK